MTRFNRDALPPRRICGGAMLLLTWLAITALCGCATGFGEDATGFVEVELLPAGDGSGAVRFESALLFVGGVELVAAEAEEEEDDHGHGHAHLASALHAGIFDGGTIDLLGGPQQLERIETRAAAYEAVHLEFEPAIGGEADSCILFATGEASLDELVRVRICAPPDGHAAEVAVGFEVGLDETTELQLVFAVDRLLEGVDLAGLDREPDGSIRIDSAHNTRALEQVQANIESAVTTAD